MKKYMVIEQASSAIATPEINLGSNLFVSLPPIPDIPIMMIGEIIIIKPTIYCTISRIYCKWKERTVMAIVVVKYVTMAA